MKCKVEGCDTEVNWRIGGKLGWCRKHYLAQRRNNGDPTVRIRREKGTGGYRNGYLTFGKDGEHYKEHRLIAEKALGKPLPAGAIVHHLNGNKKDTSNSNLVICPDEAYHQLLHRRSDLILYLKTAYATDGTQKKKYDRYVSYIDLNNKRLHIGAFSSREEAITARHDVVRSLLNGHSFKGEYL